jgi:tetratricopeptide (TPR) repeat protein
MYRSFARWMAGRSFRKGNLTQAVRWYRQSGTAGLSPRQTVEYAVLQHEQGETGRALELLNGLLSREPYPGGYERRAHIFKQTGRDTEALADLDEAIRLDPEPYQFWYSRAITHNERGEWKEAVRDFQEALKRKDDSPFSTYFELGNVYMRLGEFSEAEESYRMASEDPDKAIPHYYHRQAQALEALDRDEEALRVLTEAVRLQENWKKTADHGASEIKRRTNYSTAAVRSFLQGAEEEFGFRMYESRLLESLGRPEEALVSVQNALKDTPDAAELLLRQGVILRNLERYTESEEQLLRLKSRNPLWLPVYLELCTSLRKQDKYEEAVHVLQDAKGHFPDNTVVRFWLTDALREAERLEEAMAENRALIEMEPGDSLNWKQRGEIAIDSDQYAEADEAYSKSIELDDKADYFMRRSFARYMSEKYEDALADIQEAVKRDPALQHDGKTAYALAELYVGMENWDLAEMEYSRAIATEPQNAQIYDRRARCRAASEKLAEAIDDCNRGLAIDSSNTKLLWLRGYLHFKLDEYDSALSDTLIYSKMRPEDPRGHYNLGLVYKKLYRYDDAIGSFTKVTELNPFEPQAYLERASIWYHHSFDRIRAADDLVQWMIYASSGEGREGRDSIALLADLPGFDDDMRERARQQYRHVFSDNRYLS